MTMKFLHALAIFATASLAFAQDFFATLGIQADYPTLGAFALAATTLLIFRSMFAVLAMVILVVMAFFSDELLLRYSLDHEFLLAAALTIVLCPWISTLVKDR